MTEYRLYFLNDQDHVSTKPLELVCRDDDEAVRIALEYRYPNTMELWQLRRLVTRIEPSWNVGAELQTLAGKDPSA